MTKYIKPGSTIGIIGGGQLGKMLAQSAKQMGYVVGIFDPTEHCSAAQVADFHYQAAYDDREQLMKFAEEVDVMTFEFENISVESLKSIVQSGVYLPQGTEILNIIQDRMSEKGFIDHSEVPLAKYYRVDNEEDLLEALSANGYPAVLKTRRFGYDGKGQIMIKDDNDLLEAKKLVQTAPCVLEDYITFDREVSIMVVRDLNGTIKVFPLSENIHVNHILHQSIVPARVEKNIEKEAVSIAQKIAKEIGLVGVLGIEFFVSGNELLVNELAPRPHNSGHYSIEACEFSQFDMHIQAICGTALPDNHLFSSVIMTNILGQHLEAVVEEWPKHADWHLHLYGKGEAKVNRKMGHITQLTQDVESTLENNKNLKIWERE
ncbi:5-(carboxyamino)imidazole ribonucleotide synthase [Facklamia sp. DSM 111018]|uniref:N5-carboxyaminoimidazole ribonucleotide synthase n=1 Tax=Facklamia lactis TaxID=2749967 RepID=A0ABS0LMC3_9LACT|nr:5-(carboxyamino)imidazole ribonucleotide synthase [Facklamia lactis]MBG9980010.1 5-(carboxyamino)imidazole ribonucleotide synthase [Facklamia lactis]MBG9985310.1 5-(carboxyamino)imidazole ribonucleotide synthase [Facklamia lactis]